MCIDGTDNYAKCKLYKMLLEAEELPHLICVNKWGRKFEDHNVGIRTSFKSLRTSVYVFVAHCHHYITVSSVNMKIT